MNDAWERFVENCHYYYEEIKAHEELVVETKRQILARYEESGWGILGWAERGCYMPVQDYDGCWRQCGRSPGTLPSEDGHFWCWQHEEKNPWYGMRAAKQRRNFEIEQQWREEETQRRLRESRAEVGAVNGSKNDRCALYVMHHHDVVKVGISNDPETRRKQLIHACGLDSIQVVCVEWYDTRDAARREERRLHKLWEPYNTGGEWFRLVA